MMNEKGNDRRNFLKKSSWLLAGLGLPISNRTSGAYESKESGLSIPEEFPDNPLVLFDNFHVGNRRSYSMRARMASAEAAGFNGFEIVMVDPSSDDWKEATDLMSGSNFSVWGHHRTITSVVDENADNLNKDIEKIEEVVEASAATPIEYITLSLSGNGELRGPTIQESGSAKAEERHWIRAYKIITAFDAVCKKYNMRGSLYPHTHWICDTPQSQEKILEGVNATFIGPAFCSHHWYANKNSIELDDALKLDIMKNLNYVVMTNGKFVGNGFPAVRFHEGEIDMAWFLAKMYEFGYSGPISSQGWGIGGDPFDSCKAFVDGINRLKERFQKHPELWPLR
ncbi:MAG: sugar phosphate isomerase/epimerase family protein [Bacteroidota bacterium]